MLISEPKQFKFNGEPATIEVRRNNGFCWARIETQSGEFFDVLTRKDWYDHDDDEALAGFIRAARNPNNIEPAIL